MYGVDFLCYELSIHKIFRYKVRLMEEWCTEKITSEEFGKVMVQEYHNAEGEYVLSVNEFLMSLWWKLMDKTRHLNVNNYAVFYNMRII